MAGADAYDTRVSQTRRTYLCCWTWGASWELQPFNSTPITHSVSVRWHISDVVVGPGLIESDLSDVLPDSEGLDEALCRSVKWPEDGILWGSGCEELSRVANLAESSHHILVGHVVILHCCLYNTVDILGHISESIAANKLQGEASH